MLNLLPVAIIVMIVCIIIIVSCRYSLDMSMDSPEFHRISSSTYYLPHSKEKTPEAATADSC